MSTVTLSDLRTAVRGRADQENSGFISDTELNRVINIYAKELYDLLVDAYENDYNVQKKSMTIDGVDTAQVQTFTCPAGNASGLNNKWFRLHTTENLIKYYVWFNVSAGGTDPAPGGLTGVAVAVGSGDSSSQVATAVAAALDALAGFTASAVSAVVTCTNATTGIVDDATNQGSVPSFSIAVTVEGHDKDRYRLPADVYKMIGMDGIEGNGDPFPIRPFMFAERNRYKSQFYGYVSGRHRPRKYKMSGKALILAPVPNAMTITLWYIPTLEKLYNDGDTLETLNGWEDYVIARSARYCLSKEESSTVDVDAEIGILKDRIKSMAEAREADIGSQPIDVDADYYDEEDMLG